MKTGLYPFNRNATYWEAAIAKFGRREELGQTAPAGGQLIPATAAIDQVMATAVKETKELARVRTFHTRLKHMNMNDSVDLEAIDTGGQAATLISRGTHFTLIHADDSTERLTLEQTDAQLSPRFVLPPYCPSRRRCALATKL